MVWCLSHFFTSIIMIRPLSSKSRWSSCNHSLQNQDKLRMFWSLHLRQNHPRPASANDKALWAGEKFPSSSQQYHRRSLERIFLIKAEWKHFMFSIFYIFLFTVCGPRWLPLLHLLVSRMPGMTKRAVIWEIAFWVYFLQDKYMYLCMFKKTNMYSQDYHKVTDSFREIG